MILTEDEAKTKRCPVMSGPVVCSEVGSWIEKQNCLASGCMAWRWAPGKSAEEIKRKAEWMPPVKDDAPVGYCGL